MAKPQRPDPRQLLSQVQLFAKLIPQEMDELIAITTTRLVAAREEIFRQGDPADSAYGIFYGWLKASTVSDDGRELTLSTMGPGEMFGELSILDGGTRSATITAMEPALLLKIEREKFHALLQRNAGVAYRALLSTAARLRHLTVRMEDFAFLDVPARLSKKLLELAQEKGTPAQPGWVSISASLSQRELGEMIGATRESVNKNLKLLHEQGLVDQREGHILVCVERLRSYAEER